MSYSYGKMSPFNPRLSDPMYDPSPAGTEERTYRPTHSHRYSSPDDTEQRDLVLYYAGDQRCAPGHGWSSIRDHYLIHLIYDGCGAFTSGRRSFYLHAGQGFLIRPGRLSAYQADLQQPWTYGWFGFAGHLADSYLAKAGLPHGKTIFNFDLQGPLAECVIAMNNPPQSSAAREPYLTKLLYEFFFLFTILPPPAHAESAKGFDSAGNPGTGTIEEYRNTGIPIQLRYVARALEFIRRNFSRPIRIDAIAEYVGISRKYLSSLFRAEVGMSPQQYLLDLRMNTAAGLLADKDLPVKVVANSVGYADPLQFSRMFKRHKGVSPSDFRKIPSPDTLR